MIVLGLILLVIGVVAKIGVLSTVGVVLLVIGLIFVVASTLGHAIGGRRHIF
jgi:membrane-bound ClpP family serine protease